MQSTPERKPCGTCGEKYTVTAAGGMRSHFTDNPEFQAGPDSRKCKGAGQPPAGATAERQTANGPQCRICKHPVELTGNGRARSHLTPEATPRSCPGGSDFPLGTYPDMVGTTDGLVATIAAECDHVPVGQCYACYGEAGNPISDSELGAMEEAQGTGAAPWGVDSDTVAQPTMADQLRAAGDEPLLDSRTAAGTSMSEGSGGDDVTHLPQASQFVALLGKEVENPGTVLDRIPVGTYPNADSGAVADTFVKLGPATGLHVTDHRPTEFDPTCKKCDTDTHRCPGCGDFVPHGTVACTDCDRRVMANKLPKGETEDGRPCHHDDAMFGLEGDRLVCVACGTPCTHPDGFTENDPTEDDGEGLIFRCVLCGVVDPEAEEPEGQDCRGCGHWTFETDGLCTDCKTTDEAIDQATADRRPDTGPVLLGHLEVGDHFIRRDTVMRVTGEINGVVQAVVVEGPHKGRTGELSNLGETVERTHCRHNWVTEVPSSGLGHAGPGCEYCGAFKAFTEQETQECTDDRTTTQQPRSSVVEAATKTVPAPGSRPPTKESVPAVLPESNQVTSSAPTAKAGTSGRSAVATTEQDAAAAAAFLGGGRTVVPAQTGSDTDRAAQFLAGGSGSHGEKETDRDQYGRYLILHPDTGKEKAWTRATTFAKSISDTYALSQWGLRMCLLGATQRPDIVRRAHGKHVKADKKLLDELTAELKNAAGAKVAANDGTSMHSFTELADRAWHSPGGPRSILDQVPEDSREMVETYIRLLEETGLEPVPDLIEFTTLVKQYGVAGTSDNCYKVTKPLTLKIGRAEVRLNPGEYVIGDKKTGKDLDYGWQEIVIQLAIYAQGLNTCGRWDRREKKWYPDPLNGAKVRLDAGVIIHLPVDEASEKRPAVYGIDLESGWNAAVLCERVRAWRNVRTLAAPVMVSEAETFAPSRPEPVVVSRTTVRPPTLKDRANSVTSKGEASAVWQEAVKAKLPEAEVNELVDIMQARLAKLSEPGG